MGSHQIYDNYSLNSVESDGTRVGHGLNISRTQSTMSGIRLIGWTKISLTPQQFLDILNLRKIFQYKIRTNHAKKLFYSTFCLSEKLCKNSILEYNIKWTKKSFSSESYNFQNLKADSIICKKMIILKCYWSVFLNILNCLIIVVDSRNLNKY